MRHQRRDGIDLFMFASFPEDGVQQHAIFGRNGGVSRSALGTLNLSRAVRDDEAAVIENQRRAFGLFDRNADTLAHAHLVHGSGVARVTRADHGETPRARVDALITDEPGCGLTMNFADCTPILLYDPVHRAIGLGHAGWKGAVADLPGAMVRAMHAAFGSRPGDLWAGIGPTISVTRYEVDEPLVSAVHHAFPGDSRALLRYPGDDSAIAHRSHRPHFDLEGANRINLQRAGVRHIELSGLCTAGRTDLFYSHRAEKGKTGRFGALFLLQEP